MFAFGSDYVRVRNTVGFRGCDLLFGTIAILGCGDSGETSFQVAMEMSSAADVQGCIEDGGHSVPRCRYTVLQMYKYSMYPSVSYRDCGSGMEWGWRMDIER